ncbi:MAG TPA: tetratricopeptide repeat protein [Gemmatimonadales bacterium]|nr:tetratricopeptide repeat protein [Gemmatimonadales bacterium]
MSNRRRFPIVIVAALVPAALIACGSGEPKPTTTSSAGASAPASTANTTAAAAITPAPSVAIAYEDAEKAFRSGDYPEAVELFTAYTERRPENVWGHYMLGLSAWKEGNLARAAEAFDRALALDSAHVKSLLNSSRVFLELNETDKALERTARAIAIEPRSPDALRLRGRALHNAGDLESAIEAYREALVVDAHDVWSMNNLGLIYIELGRPADAIGPLARAVELRSNAPVFHNNLGIALEQTGHYGAAKEAFEETLAVDSTYGKARTSLERVTPLATRPGGEELILGDFATEFELQIQMWKDAEAMAIQPEVEVQVDVDTVPEGEPRE